MKMRTHTLRWIESLAGLAGALACALPAAAAPDIKVGKPAPPFKTTTVDGQHVSLADLKGDVVVLNFWATWCGPCRAELPLLDGYAKARKADGLRVIAVDYHDQDAPLWKLTQLAAKASLQVARRFDGDYRPEHDAIPTSYIIDRAGVLRQIKLGAMDASEVVSILDPLLKEPAPASPTTVASNAP
jgi:thiol-disulfide isomerase/thioredoxin